MPASSKLDNAPAVLALYVNEKTFLRYLKPATGILCLLAAAIETDDLRTPEPAGEADQQDSAIAQATEIVLQRLEHCYHVVRQYRLFLHEWGSMLATDPGEHLANVWIAAIGPLTTLHKIPDKRREPPLDRAHLEGLLAGGRGVGSERCKVEPDDLWVWRQLVQIATPALRCITPPIAGIGAIGVVGIGASSVLTCRLGELLEMCQSTADARVARDGQGALDGLRGLGIVIEARRKLRLA